MRRVPANGASVSAPERAPRIEPRQKSFTIRDDLVPLRGSDADQGFGDARGDGDSVLGIKPVVRIGDTVRVAALVDDALSAYFEQGEPAEASR